MGNNFIKQRDELLKYAMEVMVKYIQHPDDVSPMIIANLNVALSNLEISLLESEIMERTTPK